MGNSLFSSRHKMAVGCSADLFPAGKSFWQYRLTYMADRPTARTYAAVYSTATEPQSDFVAAASSVPFGGLMQVLDEHMKAIKLVYPKEYELVMRKISDL